MDRLNHLQADELDAQQSQAVQAPRGPVCIIAGAGTGKTRTITHRIANLISGGFVNPDHILAVTYTARAAAEMRERLTMMGVGSVQAKTFHAAAMKQLQYFWPKAFGQTQWTLLNKKLPLVSQAIGAEGLATETDIVRDISSEIEWAKANLIAPEDYAQAATQENRDIPFTADQVARIFANYEDSRYQEHGIILDFDDILTAMIGILETNPGLADEFRSQYRSFIVDEYQDTTPLQHRLLSAWLGDRDDLTVVGDAHQTIYSFAGATPEFLTGFSTDYPESETVRLFKDYRSTPEIVKLANTVIEQSSDTIARSGISLEGQRPPGPEPAYHCAPDEAQEASWVAARIKEYIAQGGKASGIAVLYRINSQSAALEYALEQEGILYQVKGGSGFFQRPEIMEARRNILKVLQSGTIPDGDLGEQVRTILHGIGLTAEEPSGVQEKQRWYSLDALANLADELSESNEDLSLKSFWKILTERAESQNPPDVQGVTLASIHAAKGLEWDAVFIVGAFDGMIPFHLSFQGPQSAQRIEEERRLLYVGITRAREQLSISWSESRSGNGKRSVSRFLENIVTDSNFPPTRRRSEPKASERVRKTPRVCECGQKLSTPEEKILGHCSSCAAPQDMALLEELRTWRSKVAQEQSIPAFAVVHNTTLKEIMLKKPRKVTDLTTIAGLGPAKVESYGSRIVDIVQSQG